MLKNLSLNQKIIAVQCISLLLLIGTLALAVFAMAELSARNKEMVLSENDTVSVLIQLDNMNFAVLRETKAAKDVWLRGADADEKNKAIMEFTDQLDNFQTHQTIAEEALNKVVKVDPSLAVFLDELREITLQHKEVTDKYAAQIKAHVNATDSDNKVKGLGKKLFRQLQKMRSNFVKAVEKLNAEDMVDIDQGLKTSLKLVAGAALFFIALLFAVSTLFVRSVAQQLGGDPQDVLAVVKNMASGNLLQNPGKRPVADSVLAHVYAMQGSLRDMIAKVKERSLHVGNMAHALAISAQQISANVDHESAAVSSMASSIEQLSASTSQISEQGNNAGRIASQSRNNAEEGSQVINKTVSGLLATAQEIEGASAEVSRLGDDASRISDIVKVIREIADQTNLLALNAAIEAARAGEQGRGFAVVADEVRKLAERTANATNEINQMSSKIGEVASHALDGMDKVVKTTRQGVSDAESAQASISNIQLSFTEVANVINEISVSLGEQNLAAADLAHNTERVSSMSEANAVAAQKLFCLASELEAKAQEVRQSVEVFRV